MSRAWDREEKCRAIDSFISYHQENDVCARAKIRGLTFFRNDLEVAKMSDVVDTVSDGMAIFSLTRKDEDDNPDCDARKVHFRESSICTGEHYAECIAYGSTRMQLLYLFA